MRGSGFTRRTFSAVGMLAGSLAVSVLLPLSAIAQNYEQINVFGDSLVDAGNIFNLTSGAFPPSPPYAQRLSNGPVWVEQVGAELGITSELSTAVVPGIFAGVTSPPAGGINFAVGGSFSSDQNVGGPPLPGLQQQIETFGALSAVVPPSTSSSPNALNVLLAGGNDYNEAIIRPSVAAYIQTLPDQVTDNIVSAVAALISTGADSFLVSNLPDLGFQPFADQLNQLNPQVNTQSATILTRLAAQHNQLLDQKLTALAAASGTEIIQFDLAAAVAEIAADPDSFGFANIDDPCLTDFQPDGTFTGICDNPNEFFFWDNVHPTTAGHAAIAQAALAALDESPEAPTPPDGVSVPEPTGVLGMLALSGAAIAFSRTRHRSTSES